MKEECELEVDERGFDTVFRGAEIDNITITGQLKRPSMITILLASGETFSFEPVIDHWRRGFTAAIEGRRGMRLGEDGQTVESAEKEQNAD